jgi:methanogenic corrinoid protein MtbC1
MTSLGFSGQAESAESDWPTSRSRAPAQARSALADRLAGLAGIVQDQVVPRLVDAHRPVENQPLLKLAELAKPTAGVVSELAELVVHDGDAAGRYVKALHADGLSVEAIYLNVLAPTARLLGKLWESDRRHFADVTVGVGRLQQMLHEFEAVFQSAAGDWQPDRRVLLMPVAKEQHTFGLFMIGEFMRRAGWDAWTGPLPSRTQLRKLLGSGEFGVVGLSVSSESRLPLVADSVSQVRRLAGKHRLAIMVGGGIFLERPELVREVGADGTAADARAAIILARGLLQQIQSR